MKQAYITALLDSLRTTTDVDGTLSRTYSVLQKRGHIRLWPAILRGVLRELEAHTQADVAHVYVAKSTADVTAEIKQALASLGATDTYEQHIDDTLIGGYVVTYKDKILDASYKRKLVELYRRITK